MRDNHYVIKDKKRWRVILVRILVLCMLLPCMHLRAFAASQSIRNGYYMIQSGNSSSKVLDINNWNLNDGGNLEIYQKNQTTNQIFYIQYVKTVWNWKWWQNTQYYTIRCLHSGKYIHTADGRYTNANVHQWSGCNTDNALWGLRSVGNGHYYFMNKASGACLDNSGGKAVDANNVITYSWNKSAAQQWKPISVNKTGFGGNISSYVALSGKYTTSDSKTVTGNASMTYPVTKVQIGIFNESGKYIRGTYMYPNYINYSYRYTFSFSGLTAGRYYFRVRMWNVWGEITRTNASYFNVVDGSSVSYAPYYGINYAGQTNNGKRIAALDKAKRMVTIKWKAPCDFYSWKSQGGSYNGVSDVNGNVSYKYVSGRTYTGIPYSMAGRDWDENGFADALKKKIVTTNYMKGKYYTGSYDTTGHGVDCSKFVYYALTAANTGTKLRTDLTTKSIPTCGAFYKLKNYDLMKPGDIVNKSGHVRMYVGSRTVNRVKYYGFFEAAAECLKEDTAFSYYNATKGASRCVYCEYTATQLSKYNYKPYRFKGFGD